MIVPITKYRFVVYHRDYEEFLEELRAIGRFHIKEQKKTSSVVSNWMKERQQFEDIYRYYHKTPDNLQNEGTEIPTMVIGDWLEVIDKTDQLKKEISNLRKEKFTLENTIGSFSVEKIKSLEKHGIYSWFFSCKPGSFEDDWTKTLGAEKLNVGGRKTYFVIFTKVQEQPVVHAQAEILPDFGPEELALMIEEKNSELAKLESELEFFWETRMRNFNYTWNTINDRIQLRQVGEQSDTLAEDKLHVLEAWVPEEFNDEIAQVLKNRSVYFETSEPDPEDKNPIMLQNNKYSRLFEPIGSLFSMPTYAELDLTPLFAPFFTLFFGFCLGDAGYGLIILLGITLFGKKLGEANKGIVRLGQILGLATVIFGSLTGTLFGVSLGAEQSTLLPANVKANFLDSDQLFALSLIIGWIQIIFGMVIRAVNQTKQFGFVYSVSTMGWIVMTFGLTYWGLAAYEFVPEHTAGPVLSGIGAGAILLFNDPKANIFTRIGKGLWELYGISGLFGDLLSYIRLFALGLSSSILGLVVNDIGLGFLDIPYAGPVLFAIFMVIGHGLNLFIAGLGSFVHPMRLTFVEFYKNAGFAGGGIPFKTFKKETT